MTTRILVPLDGSALAEQVLPAVKKFAAGRGSCRIELFYVIDPLTVAIPGAGGVLPSEYLPRTQEWATEYLREQAKAVAGPDTQVDEVVSIGPPARVILDHSRANQFDYVFMATHGRSGLARVMTGSVTDRVIRGSTIPVVAVHPQPVAPSGDPWPGDNAAAAELIHLFARGDVLSVRAMDVLAQRGAAAVPELTKALADDVPEVRRYAARTLGSIAAGKAAVGALVGRLSDEVWEVRWEAEEALVRFGADGVVAVLENLRHALPDARLYQAMLHVLDGAPLELRQTVKPVIHALQNRDSSLGAPIAAAKALQKLRHSVEVASAS